MFLQTNDRIVNLQNVSNINILEDRNRIIFNLNYNIEISSYGKPKLISDYVYWDSSNHVDFSNNLLSLTQNEFFIENYIYQINGNGFINKNEISSVKFSDKKNRIIFNLSHPVTFKDFEGNDKITSEFVYVNCKDYAGFKEYKAYIENTLK